MTLLLDERYETGPAGATLDTTTTAFTAVGGTSTNGSRTFTSNAPHEGSLCGEYVTGSTTGSMWTRYDPPAALGTVYLRAYVRFVTALPGNNTGIVYWRTAGGTVRARLEVNAAGTFTIKNGTTAVATSTVATAIDEWCRLEWELVNGTGQTLRIFVGANVDGATPDETITGTFNTGSDGQQFLMGWAAAVANRTLRLDAVAVDDATWVGPLATNPHGTTVLSLAAAFTATGHAVGALPHGTATLTATPTLTGTGHKVGLGNSLLQFAPNTTATGHAAAAGPHGSTSLAATAATVATGHKVCHATASIFATATLTSTAHRVAHGATMLESPAVLTAVGHVAQAGRGSTLLALTAVVVASGHRIAYGTTAMVAVAAFTARGHNGAVPNGRAVANPRLTLDLVDSTLTLTIPASTLELT